jgi:hypothetical protein
MAPAMTSLRTKPCRLMAAQSQPRPYAFAFDRGRPPASGLQKITAGTADPLKSKAFAARRR